jgi:peptidylprolyl isomerase
MKSTITLRTLLFAAAILFGLTTSITAADGQAKKGRTTPARNRRTTKSTKPKPVANAPATTTTPSGLVYVITRPSNGRQPQVGETVVVHYTGLLGSGAKFDSSMDHPGGQPFTFKLGVGRVIKAWDEGIAKLRVGEQATLFIPPQLGYGIAGHPPQIPANSTLIFIVELIEIRASN